MALEWHAFLAIRDRRFRLVGRVEAVDREGIRLTTIDRAAGLLTGSEVYVPWEEVDCIAVCGPGRDEELFDLTLKYIPPFP